MKPDTTTGSKSPCCSPALAGHKGPTALFPISGRRATKQGPQPHDDVPLPGGTFLMGDAFAEGYPSDGESPVHEVTVHPFRLDRTAVTNAMFADFVAATGYKTEAERYGSSAVFHLLVGAPKTDIRGVAAGAPWWVNVAGADWSRPGGQGTSWRAVPDHPVVHVSHNDALAYCVWAGRRLPTEAEWEYAARGGLTGKRFAWGNSLLGLAGQHLCNIWQGNFPATNTADDGFLGTAPVRSFPANNFGLYEVSGNVWEWCSDWFASDFYTVSPKIDPSGPLTGSARVMRGGSYLCHSSYCSRYRVAARSSNTPESSSGNCGFRTAAIREDDGPAR